MKLNETMIKWLNEPLNNEEIELAIIRCNEMKPLKNIPFVDLFHSLRFLKPIFIRI